MRTGIAFAVSLACAGATMLPAAAATPTSWHTCDGKTKTLCGTVVAPLDPSGGQPGTVKLHVEVLRAPAKAGAPPPKKALFLIAGGPGQAAANAFDLVSVGAYYQALFPGYALVVFDDRGTGRSGSLTCRSSLSITACGEKLGTRRVFYSTEANASDTEAVRRALGFDRISLYGVSYGTAQILAYAQTYPSHVARLVLDSVALPNSDDVFGLITLRAVRGSIEALCQAGACRAVTNDPVGDLGELANKLQDTPLYAKISVAADGKKERVRVDGLTLLSLAIDTDLNPGVAAELPAAVRAALDGKPRPLERLVALTQGWASSGAYGVNSVVQVSTDCSDGVFPWSATTPVADRRALFDSAMSALAPAATAPFGNWAARIGNADACQKWPASPRDTLPVSGRFPNVPVLILSGSRDMRTPTVNARAIAKEFPKSRLLVVNGAGHALLGSSVCAVFYAATWLAGVPRGTCPRQVPALAPIGPFTSASDSKAGPLTSTETFFAAKSTLQEAEATWLATLGASPKLKGFLGGTLIPMGQDSPLKASFKFTRYSAVPGVWLTGEITYRPLASTRWSGDFTVTGPRAARGSLAAANGRLIGHLGGKYVTGRTTPPLATSAHQSVGQ